MGLQVYKECCKNCLLSKDSIVSPARRKDIITGCTRRQTYFICHKSSMNEEGNGNEIVCATFYKTLGHVSQMIRIAERMNMVEFIEQPEHEKLPTYSEMNKTKTKKL